MPIGIDEENCRFESIGISQKELKTIEEKNIVSPGFKNFLKLANPKIAKTKPVKMVVIE